LRSVIKSPIKGTPRDSMKSPSRRSSQAQHPKSPQTREMKKAYYALRKSPNRIHTEVIE
jgi:hypothetical protein